MMDAWQRWLDGEAEEWRLLLREEFGETAMNFYQQVAQAVQEQHSEEVTRRVFFTCRSSRCKHRWVREYFEYAGKWYRLSPSYLYSLEEDARCPECQSRLVKYDEVVGTISNKPCDEHCLTATGHVCNCSCGGKNHGKGHV